MLWQHFKQSATPFLLNTGTTILTSPPQKERPLLLRFELFYCLFYGADRPELPVVLPFHLHSTARSLSLSFRNTLIPLEKC